MNNFKLNFLEQEKIEKSHSQSGQDIFVLSCLDGKTSGVFLDLGCRHPLEINNTYILEKLFNWSGVSVDIDEKMIDLYASSRKTHALCHDATKLNFDHLIDLLGTNHVDYLSLDLEPASVTEECLKSIPFDKIKFSLITYEHDSYRFGEKYKFFSRELLTKHGYKLLCSDICNKSNSFEDWYYNPDYVSYERIRIFESSHKEWNEIIYSGLKND